MVDRHELKPGANIMEKCVKRCTIAPNPSARHSALCTSALCRVRRVRSSSSSSSPAALRTAPTTITTSSSRSAHTRKPQSRHFTSEPLTSPARAPQLLNDDDYNDNDHSSSSSRHGE
ncbi:unnamed protein product [Lampetra planeri]